MSSSATTEATPGGRASRRVPAILLVAGVLAVLLVVGGVLALVGNGGTPANLSDENALVGQHLQDRAAFTLPTLDRVGVAGTVRPGWWRPHGAVLLFFAHWCVPCRAEVPSLARVLGRGDVSGVKIVGFDGDESPGTAAAFVRSSHVHFEVLHDGGLALAGQLVPQGFPAAVFVQPSGKIVAVDYGALSVIELDAGLSKIGKPKDA
jgi:thiol-disulfide isomerase/thioredoxin